MVKDKITLCRQMLPESPGVEEDDALSEVVGFLEACRPRMVDLVEAGMGGALGEDIFAECLQVCEDQHDEMCTVYRTLSINVWACLAGIPWKTCGAWRRVVSFDSLHEIGLGQQGQQGQQVVSLLFSGARRAVYHTSYACKFMSCGSLVDDKTVLLHRARYLVSCTPSVRIPVVLRDACYRVNVFVPMLQTRRLAFHIILSWFFEGTVVLYYS